MILTTTNTIEGHKIHDYLGVISGIGINEKAVSMGFSMKKYYKSLADNMSVVKEQAFQNLKANAIKLKANAIVGIKVDIELTTSNYAIVSVTGTAVMVA